jgi:hypothetical protein
MISLRQKVFGGLQPKRLYGHALTGGMLAAMLQSYTAAINGGGVPTVANAWSAMKQVRAGRFHLGIGPY